MTTESRLTVLMSVYNAECHLSEAIDSILNQTCKDFEFLIMNDGSTDSSRDIITGYSDSRIHLIDNEKNLGLTKSLNRGIELSSTKYIARMDADDISLPKRLEGQIAFMEANPDEGVCGCWYRKVGSTEKTVRTPEGHDEIRLALFFKNTLGHSTVMMRSSVLKEHGLCYDESMKTAQDYYLWVRLAELTRCANIPQVCLLYRVYPEQISGAVKDSQDESADRVRSYQLERLGIEPTPDEWKTHRQICQDDYAEIDLKLLDNWIEKLIHANNETGYFDDRGFAEMLSMKYWHICKQRSLSGARMFRKSKTFMQYRYPFGIRMKSMLYGAVPMKQLERRLKAIGAKDHFT